MSDVSASMMPPVETILVVDDEDSVRRTFREWLESADLGADILSASDAEQALTLANQRGIDLAILDWNLGAGNDGLQLLEDLAVFNADVVAIMITGYAHQATPLKAMRMGVRDYLDKNQDLTRETFLAAVRRQLERIRPARRERRLHVQLVAFREAVEKVLPLARSAAALNDPLSLPETVAGLFRFLMRFIRATDGALLVRSYDASRQPAEQERVYNVSGEPVESSVPFSRSLAGAVCSSARAQIVDRPEEQAVGAELRDFERGHRSMLIAPLWVGPGLQVVVELFDKENGGFTEQDRELVTAASVFGGEILRQALSERQTHRALLDAVAAAIGASDSLQESLHGSTTQRLEEPPPDDVMRRLREGLSGPESAVGAEDALELAQAVRVLALRHGPRAVRHCTDMVEGLRRLLDSATGNEEAGA
jgi:ActR/RegA family two-component response regulator